MTNAATVAGLSIGSDNGCAFSVPPGRAMSNNRRTRQDMGLGRVSIACKRQLTQQNGGLA
ncbi:hypothetical protein MB901379_04118 [Mycobacterium basiliense]|uniref:Uncharacterized protein n=1 Tax=Mycobacterium basiliense TaxID=2094119 RepID=A0A447GJ42_9MYCO|nr:hypothetical protein MB901379_04118 [Mycobacterium basiliense]